MADVLEDDAVPADANDHRRGRDPRGLEPVAQRLAQLLRLGRIGTVRRLKGNGLFEPNPIAANSRGDDLQLLVVPVKDQVTGHG